MVLAKRQSEAIQKGADADAKEERIRSDGGLFPMAGELKRFPARPQLPAVVLERWIRFWLDSRAHHLDRRCNERPKFSLEQ